MNYQEKRNFVLGILVILVICFLLFTSGKSEGMGEQECSEAQKADIKLSLEESNLHVQYMGLVSLTTTIADYSDLLQVGLVMSDWKIKLNHAQDFQCSEWNRLRFLMVDSFLSYKLLEAHVLYYDQYDEATRVFVDEAIKSQASIMQADLAEIVELLNFFNLQPPVPSNPS